MEKKLGIYNLENQHGKFISVRDEDNLIELFTYYDNPQPGQDSYDQALEKARNKAKWHFKKSIETLIEMI